MLTKQDNGQAVPCLTISVEYDKRDNAQQS